MNKPRVKNPLELFIYYLTPSRLVLTWSSTPSPLVQPRFHFVWPYLQRSFCERLIHRLDDGSSMHLWNVSQLQRDYTAQFPSKLWSWGCKIVEACIITLQNITHAPHSGHCTAEIFLVTSSWMQQSSLWESMHQIATLQK
jgi:hypothetical protein